MSKEACKKATPPDGLANVKDNSMTFRKSLNGHFMVAGVILEKRVEFMLDTGATLVSLTYKDAQRLGLDVINLDYSHPVNTANGRSYVAHITIDTLSVGSITLRKVSADVSKTNAGESLLGMSFLSKLEKYAFEGNCLTMWGKYEAPREDKKPSNEDIKPNKSSDSGKKKTKDPEPSDEGMKPKKPSRSKSKCVKDMAAANERIKDAQAKIELAKAREAHSKVKDPEAKRKVCGTNLGNTKVDKKTCESMYKGAIDKAMVCQKAERNIYDLITAAVAGLNEGFEKGGCPSLKLQRVFLYSRKGEDIVAVTKEGKLAFVGDKLLKGDPTTASQCEESLKEALAKASELEGQEKAFRKNSSKADRESPDAKLAECRHRLEIARKDLERCREDGKNSSPLGIECNRKLQEYACLEKTLVTKINDLIYAGCALPVKTELWSNSTAHLWVGQSGKVVLTCVGQDSLDEL